jgi:hypothetical protein
MDLQRLLNNVRTCQRKRFEDADQTHHQDL